MPGSFPGQMTLEEWLALPDIGRRDMISRAACTLLECERFCTNGMCRRHRSCCGDDAMECELRLWRLPRLRLKALQRELYRLEHLADLGRSGRKTFKDGPKCTFWTKDLDEPWNAPSNPPWAPVLSAGAFAGLARSGAAALEPPAKDIITRTGRAGDFSGEGG
jgi:hypothetical protein